MTEESDNKKRDEVLKRMMEKKPESNKDFVKRNNGRIDVDKEKNRKDK